MTYRFWSRMLPMAIIMGAILLHPDAAMAIHYLAAGNIASHSQYLY